MPTVAHAPVAVLPDVQASQSTVIVVALIGAFLLWLLLTGRLAAYWALLTGGGATSAAPSGSPSASSPNPPNASSPNPPASGPPSVPNLSTIPGTNIPNPLCILGGTACGSNPAPAPGPSTSGGLRFTVPGYPQ